MLEAFRNDNWRPRLNVANILGYDAINRSLGKLQLRSWKHGNIINIGNVITAEGP